MDNDKPTKIRPRRMTRFQEINFRAGLLGLPFCVVEYILKREPIFFLGGGFFAALFFIGLREWWRLGRPPLWQAPPPGDSKDEDR
jgi:hypothetical protein